MDEARPDSGIFGLVAEFTQAEELVAGARRAREAGFRRIDAFTPFPIDDLSEALDVNDNKVPWLTLGGGLFGAALGFGMQVYTNLAYPIEIGGRPLIAPQAFMLITVELMVLFAVLSAIGGMLLLNRLPRLNHPMFGVEDFDRASSDRFFLLVLANDVRFDEAQSFLEGLKPRCVRRVAHTEEPE